MAQKTIWTDEEKKDIIQLYLAGNSQADIGRKYKKNSTVIKKVLLEANIPIRSSKEQKAISKVQSKKNEISSELEQSIIDNYVIEQKSLYCIAKNTGVSQYLIEKILKNNGVKKRTYAEAKQNSRVYTINDDFFKIQSHDMAYVLGLIASDGNISRKENCITIELEKSDDYLLENINKITNNSRPLKYYTYKRNDSSTVTEVAKFQTWSYKWKQDLSVYNIVPNKTHILQPPTFLKDEFYISYIKGYFDGDGSVYTDFNIKRCTVSFVGASKPLIEWIKNILINKYGIISSKIEYRILETGNDFYRFLIGNQEGIKKLYKLWYIDNTSPLFLKRKKERFEKFFSHL